MVTNGPEPPLGARGVPWQTGTVEPIVAETPRTKTFTLALPQWRRFKPGQHYDVRLTAPDGYQAQRSYSIASAPENEGAIDLTIELLEGGEVSPFFHEVVEVGDSIEARGPIGGPFAWTANQGGPLLLIGGGTGIVPLMSMLRHQAATAPGLPALLLYSSRSYEDIIYRSELEAMESRGDGPTILHTLTRSRPDDWKGYGRRIDQEMLGEAMQVLGQPAHAYVCGSTPFVESAANALVETGVPPDRVRTERFGPSAP